MVLAFTLVGRALETIMNPRLRTGERRDGERMSLLEMRDLHVTYATERRRRARRARGQPDASTAARSSASPASPAAASRRSPRPSLRLSPSNAKVTGQVLLDGEDVLTMRWGELRAVRWAEASIVFQGALHSLNPVRTIGRQIAEPILLHEKVSEREANARVGELLEQVGLPARRANAYPHQLSGGQKQRVMIAMALACRPQLVIADEPTTALDVMVQAQVLDLISALVRDLGVGMMIISHDLSVLGATCDRVAVMYAGRVVEEGPADQVFQRPEHPYTGALSGAFPTIGDLSSRRAPRGLPGDPPDPAQLPSGCTVPPALPVGHRPLRDDRRARARGRPGRTRAAACILVRRHRR